MSGEVIVVDANRPTEQHGTPPRLLKCELEAVGYRLVAITPRPDAGGYLARFSISGNRPEPHDIVPCGIRREGGKKRSEEHTSELQSLMRISYAVFCLKKKQTKNSHKNIR